MRRFFLLAALVALAVPGWAASGPAGHGHEGSGHPGHAAEAARTVRLEARDTAFDLGVIEVRRGETVRFVVTNKGEVPHEFAIASPEEQAAHRAMMREMPEMAHDEANVVTLQPGETKELVWRFDGAGALEFSCNLPGHAEQGMTGVFRVVR
jgi:uncharacterized cupredoxin-like copper-binding protein